MSATDTLRKVLNNIPKVSPLEGEDPTGRVDVAASRILERIITTKAAPQDQQLYRDFKPAIDTVLLHTLGPTSVGTTGKRRTRPRGKGGRVAA